ncbi:MAG: hypothetical protein M3515_01740 [Actinomycetota bacterium]|jgi:hypothetical protein|nr:hypothetical protein [Actinomycetota bacterium]MDQ3356219.1 hypothetical protein [Actinomycetota bacterium]
MIESDGPVVRHHVQTIVPPRPETPPAAPSADSNLNREERAQRGRAIIDRINRRGV